MYKNYIKRLLDIIISFGALVVLSPLLIVLTIVGTISMQGNPFFTQKRPGKNEKIFKIIKFRTMNNKKDTNGTLLPDEKRLTTYGKFLRSTTMDELPEFVNILKGDMAFVGPRPLLVQYLPRYNEEQKHRHDIRPGLTGYAQTHGRNAVTWEEKFKMDVWYVNNVSLILDIKIIFKTISTILNHKGVHSNTSSTMEEFLGNN